MESARNYLTLDETQALEAMANSMGVPKYWNIVSLCPDTLVYCLLCNSFICDYYEIDFQKLLVSHMLKHLKLKAFL